MKADRGSVWMIVLANATALAVAWWQHWPLHLLLWPYWIQSVVIGWYSCRRILALKRFSTEGTTGFAGGSDDDVKQRTVRFFAMHYGIFHLGYLFFIYMFHRTGRFPEIGIVDIACIAALGASFALTHGVSFKRNLENDLGGRPNIAVLMFLPYARVVPMHLTMILGMQMGSTGAVLMFGTLKSAADLLMHWVEHRILAAPVRPKPKL